MNTQTTNNVEDSPCTAVVPSNSILISTIPLSDITKGTIITPSTQTTNTPLTPEFTAKYATSAKENITITATVKIDAAVTINDLQIYMNNDINSDGNYILAELYVGYCYQEEAPVSLYPYTFSFEIGTGSTLGTISEIELYLYNEDPITSSGKKATVQPST
jgi:hypothetical protein